MNDLPRAEPHRHQPGGIDFIVVAPDTMLLAQLRPVPGPRRPNVPEMLIALPNLPERGDALLVPATNSSEEKTVEVAYVESAEIYLGANGGLPSDVKYPAAIIYIYDPE